MPKATGPSNHGLKPWAKNQLFPPKLILSFRHSDVKVSDTQHFPLTGLSLSLDEFAADQVYNPFSFMSLKPSTWFNCILWVDTFILVCVCVCVWWEYRKVPLWIIENAFIHSLSLLEDPVHLRPKNLVRDRWTLCVVPYSTNRLLEERGREFIFIELVRFGCCCCCPGESNPGS